MQSNGTTIVGRDKHIGSNLFSVWQVMGDQLMIGDSQLIMNETQWNAWRQASLSLNRGNST